MKEIWKNSAIISKRNVDENQSPISVKISELKPIIDVHSCVVLDQLPAEFSRVKVDGYTEVRDIEKVSTRTFKVDYANGVLYFHPNNIGKTVGIEYQGIGYTLISASRVFTKYDKWGNVLETLEEMIDKGKLYVKAIEELGGAVPIIERLENANRTGTMLYENLSRDVEIAVPLQKDLRKDINEANTFRQQLNRDVIDGKTLSPELKKNIIDGTNVKSELERVRTEASADISKINATGNKSLVIGSSQFVNNSYTWKHDMGSDNLIVTFMDSVSNEPLMPDYKIVDKNNIIIRNSTEHPNVKVVLSASFYQGNSLFGANTEEFAGSGIGNGGKTVRLKDVNGYQYPVTKADAVYMSDGTTKVSKKINDIESNYTLSESFNDESITIVNEISPAVQEKLGNLSNLTTKDKTNLVNAINQTNAQLEQKAHKSEVRMKNTLITMSDVGQDVKTALTGGSVAVVGENTVVSTNVVDNQIISTKLGVDVLKFEDVNLIYNFYPDSFVNWAAGILTTNTDYVYTDYIRVVPGEKLYCKVQTHHSFYNENKEFISGVQGIIPGEENNLIQIPGNAFYIRLSTKKTISEKFVLCKTLEFVKNSDFYTLSNTLNGKTISLKGEWVGADNIKNNSITKEKADKYFVTHTFGKNKFFVKDIGYLVNWDFDTLLANDLYVTSDYIDVKEGQQIYQSTNAHYCFYDQDFKRVAGNRLQNTPTPFIVPPNAKYLRVSPEKNNTKYIITIDNPDLTYEAAGTHLSSIANNVPIIELENLKEEIKSIKGEISINSRFKGKKVSWYGTSVTQGYGWCSLVNNVFNFNATNNGVGGSTVSNESISSMCNLERMLGQYSNVVDPNTGQTTVNGIAIPKDVEVIFVEGGTNDWARNWIIGDKTFSQTPNDKTFAGACHKMFNLLTKNFPNAEIIVVGSPFGKMANRTSFTNQYGILNNNNLQTVDYGDILLEVAGLWGIKGLNIGREMQIHDNNISTLIPDGLHLNTAESQKRASDAIVKYLLSLK